jgi:hypothetical protein
MLNYIPVIGWALAIGFAFCIAIPFWIVWNWLAPTYFYWLPSVYLSIPFWHCFGLFLLAPMVRSLVGWPPVSASATTEQKKSKE